MKSLVNFANSRNIELNILLNSDKQIDELIDELFEKYELLDITSIRSNKIEDVKYTVIRDSITRTWFFVTKNIFILHLPMSQYFNFYEVYKNSNKYRFLVYIKPKGINDSKSEIVVFCISHVVNDETYDEFMEMNKKWSKRSSYILSKRLGFFLPINRSYNNFLNKQGGLLGVHILGNGEYVDSGLQTVINFILKWINDKSNKLPYHHLILNK